MSESNLQVLNHDLEKIIKEAQALYAQALRVSENKASRVQLSSQHMLENTLQKMQHAGGNALARSRALASSAGDYVHENPWRSATAVTAIAGIAVLLALIFKPK
ncbi:MAG: DUF883 family protein [Burkholderiales bacterium]|nr:DUF883 family protein [Burkholderiales bacterium]